MDALEIARMDPAEAAVAIATTSRAFWPDPLFGFFARDAVQEHRVLPTFMGAMLRDAESHGEVWVARRSGVVVGSASWVPPGSMPRSRSRENRITRACASALLLGRNRRRGLKLLAEVDGRHPREPHWYLALLGVDPRWQSHGIGGALLRPMLERCDESQTPAYLETQKIENLGFYERFGFRVTDTIELADTPPVWLMWRDPRP